MEAGRRRGRAKTGVVAGSVWESRMKNDDVKGGIKAFNAEEKAEEKNTEKKSRPKQSPIGVTGKRKTWKSENSDGSEQSPVQVSRQISEPNKDLDQQCKELSVSADDGMKIIKSPVRLKQTRSEVGKEPSVSVDRIERNPIQIRKCKSLIAQPDGESGNGDGVEKSPVQLRKVKSESIKCSGESGEGNERNSIPLTKGKMVSNKDLDDPGKDSDGFGDGIGRNSTEFNAAKSEPNKAGDESVKEIEETRSEENSKELDVCEDKVISSSMINLGQVKSTPEMVEEEEDDVDGEEEDWDEELDDDNEVDEEIAIEEAEKSFEVKEIDVKEEKPKQIVMNDEQKKDKVQEKPVPISPIVKKQAPPPPVVNHSRIHPIPTKTKAVPVPNGFQRAPETHSEFQRIPETHNNLQSLVDLVMWRDVSKSAFIFGLGTFIIISFSYTKNINISFITVASYLGLVYLAAIFLFRSIICRGVIDADDSSQAYVVGEQEAMWLLRMVLPYLNEFLLKLRALFSGDPATTMKLAVLLFVLARCGSSITIWKMAKLGKFWVRRFKDAWDTCTHKKAVAFGIFTVVWNFSSVVARIWAVFMLYVAFRYYQQSLVGDDDNWVEEEPKCETSTAWQDPIGEHRRGRRTSTTTVGSVKKEKKKF